VKLFIASLVGVVCAAPLRAAPPGGGNDDCSTATVLTAGTHTGFHLSDHWYWEMFTHNVLWNTDFDWYRFTVQPGQQLTVQMNITAVVGQIGFSSHDLMEAHPVSCTDPVVPAVTNWSVINSTAAPKDYLLLLFAWSGLTQSDLDLDYDLVVTTAPVLVQSYCPGAINSLGLSSTLTMQGSPSISAGALSFTASNVNPFTPAQLFKGSAQVQVPFGDGVRCVGGAIHRLVRHNSTPWGYWSGAVQYGLLPPAAAILPGSTWNFQVLYRDLNGPLNTGFNLSSAVSVTFAP
jgi:hypothetical protein